MSLLLYIYVCICMCMSMSMCVCVYIYIYIAKPSSWYQIYSILCTNGQCQKDCRNGYIQVTKLQTKRVNNSVRLQSSHLPQVIKPRLQVIIYSTIHPACGFSLSRNFSCCDRLSNCSGRSLDKLRVDINANFIEDLVD